MVSEKMYLAQKPKFSDLVGLVFRSGTRLPCALGFRVTHIHHKRTVDVIAYLYMNCILGVSQKVRVQKPKFSGFRAFRSILGLALRSRA